MAEHADIVQDSFWPVVDKALEWLLQIAQMKTRDVRKLGWAALVNYVACVASILVVEDHDDDKVNEEKKKQVCKEFVQRFLGILQENWQLDDVDVNPGVQASTGLADTSLPMVIRALGQFAPAISKYFGHEQLRTVLQELIEYAQVMFIEESGESMNPNARAPDIESHLSKIMISLAQIIRELPAIDEDIKAHVDVVVEKKLMVLFPRLLSVAKQENCEGLWKLLLALDTVDFHISEALIDVVVREAVSLAVSRQESTVDDTVIKYLDDYVEFFQLLLDERAVKGLCEDDRRRHSRLARRVYDELIERVLSNLDRLDLSFVKQQEARAEPTGAAQQEDALATTQIAGEMEELGPSSPQDYELYLEHVELCTKLLPNLTPEMFNNWAYEFTARIARLCEKDETACRISGHYKLMRIAFQLCAYGENRQEGFFDGGDVAGVDTRQACRAEFLTFVRRASTRMTQFKDELLVAAVQSVTSVPLAVLQNCISALVEPMRLGLKLGVSYTPLAEHAIGTLECWLEHSGTLPEALKAVVHDALEDVLPALNGYLYVSAEEGQLSSDEIARAEKSREVARREGPKDLKDDELRRRVLRFLGRFGGRTRALVGASSVSDLENEISWDRTERVQVSIPFPIRDQPEIFLDKLLPRIVELAEGSSDRKTKVSACELLHAIVLHYVATNAANNDQGKCSSGIYSQLFPVLLRLSVDGETVARNLFEPLMRQLITWFTDPGRDKQGGITEMLDAVADAVCHPTNSTLREAAAGKFALLLKWSLKQYGGRSRRDERGSPTPLTIEGLFNKIFHMATHPDPYKRIGASLAFRQLANEMINGGTCTASVVDEYLFQFVDNFLTGLRLSEKDSEALDAASLATKSIRYCVRVFKYRSDCDFSKGHPCESLRRCVERALIGTGDGARAYREVCSYLYLELVSKLHVSSQDEDERYTKVSYLQVHPLSTPDAVDSIAHYLDYQGWANDTLISLYENRHVQLIKRLDKPCQAAQCMSILAAISSCACGYTFLIKNEIVRAEGLLGAKSSFMGQLESWIRSFAGCSIETDFVNSYKLTAAAELVPETCWRAFTQALLDAFGFVAAALEDGSFARPEQFVQHLDRWLGLALMCLTHPIKMCFVDVKQQVALRDTLGVLLSTLGSNLSLAAVAERTIKGLYVKFVKDKPCWMATRLHKFNLACKEDYANLLPVILNHGTLIRSLPDLRKFFQKFIQKVFSLRGRSEKEATAITIDPDASTSDVTISKAVLEFCLNTDVSLTHLTEAMTDKNPADTGGADGRTRGEVFCNRYGELIRQTVFSDDSSSISLDEFLDMLCNCSLEFPYLYEVIDEVIKGCMDEQRKKTILETVVTFFNSAPHLPQQATNSVGIHISKRMALIDTLVRRSAAGSRSVISSGVLTQVFMDSLDIRKNRLSTVEAALRLVPWVLGADEDEVTRNIILKLKDICSEKITYVLDPDELLRPGKGKELSEWVQLLKQMLTMLTMCNSVRVVELFYPLLAMQKDHVHKRLIFKAFECFAANHATPDLFHVCWCETRDHNLSFPLRQALMDYICAPMILFMDPASSRAAVARVMGEVTTLLEPLPPMTCAKLEAASLAFSLLEVAYRKLSSHVKRAPNRPHSEQYPCPPGEEDRAFYRDILKKTTRLFNAEVILPDGENEEAFRESRKQYHTRAFRLAARCLVKTQTKGKFFDQLLLKFEKGSENMWSAVVGTQDAPEPFTAESTFATQNSAIGLLREQTREEKELTLAQPSRYSSQFIEGSSLAADVGYTMPSMSQNTQQETVDAMDVDMPDPPSSQQSVNSQTLSPPQSSKRAALVEIAEDGGVVTSVNPDTMVELDPLNQNPCMDATMRLVRFRFKISEAENEYNPPWITSLEYGVKQLVREMPIDRMDRGTDGCGGKGLVLLYMVKIIMNTPKEFAPYAERFLEPMVIIACKNVANGGTGIHYFVRDICTTLLRWVGMHDHDPNASPPIGLDSSSETCIEHIGALVAHLITHVLSHQLSQTTWKKIFHANLSLIQDFVETFQPARPSEKYISVPADIFDGLLQADDARFKAGGIQALSLCLQNNVQIVDSATNLEGLYKLIIPLLGHRSKSVQGPAAELLAYALRLGHANDPRGIATDKAKTSMMFQVLHQVHQFSRGSKAADANTFVYALYKMCSGGKVDEGHFNGAPHVAKFFRAAVIHVLPKLRGDFLTRGIQILVYLANDRQLDGEKVSARDHDQWEQHKSEDALKILTEIRPWVIGFIRQRHPGVQLSTLQLLSVVTRQLCLKERDVPGAPCRDHIAHFMPVLCQVFSSHKKVKCRELFFSIAIWVWERFGMDSKHTVGPSEETDALCEARMSIQRVLINGMADEAEVVRLLLYSFWNNTDRLDGDMSRVPQLLTKVYIPEIEERWTGIASSLLLQICEDSDRWSDKPFSGLVSSTGQRKVDVHKWSTSPNPFTTPLYSSSQSLLPTGMVEATQDMPVDLSQTFARRDASQTMSELAEATVMQVVEREKTISRQYKRDRDGFKIPSPKGVIEDSMAAGYVRFQKRRRQGGSSFVVRAEKKRKREAALIQSERTTKTVRMIRAYRKGERPDFGGLSMKDIFDPLRDLALKDRLFSRMLMDVLFAATTSRQLVAKFCRGQEQRQAYTEQLATGLCGILQRTHGSPTIVSWLLGALERLTWNELSTNRTGLTPNQIVSRIGQLSLQSCCYHRGIKTLESLELCAQYEQRKRQYHSERSGSSLGTVATGTLAASNGVESSIASVATSNQLSAVFHEMHLQLGSIYRALGDEDTAIAIWSQSVQVQSDSSSGISIMTEALHLEITQKYIDAQTKYMEAKKAGADVRICNDGLYACAARLQDWDEIAKVAGCQLRLSLKSSNEQLSRYDCREVLGRFLKGYMKTGLDSRTDARFLEDHYISDCLNTMHPLSSGILALYDGDRAKAEVSVDMHYNQFTTEWSTYHKLARNVRSTKLRGLQRAVEMEETMDCIASLNRLDATHACASVDSLLESWRSRPPPCTEDTDIWADLLTDRQTNLRAIEKRILDRRVSDHHWDSIVTNIRAAEDSWCRDIAEIAADRAETELCNRHRKALPDCPGSGAKLIAATLFVREEQRNTQRTYSEKLAKYSKGLAAMNKRFTDQDADYMASQGRAHLLKAELCTAMMKTIFRICEGARDHSWVDSIQWAQACETTHSDAGWQIREANDAFVTAEDMLSQDARLNELSNLRCTYANFCRDALAHTQSQASLAETMVQQLLQAMEAGSEAARMNFPSVLTVLSEHPSTRTAFAKYSTRVPVWMFLMWCRQIISRVNQVRPETDVLIGLLLRLAKEYPQTVFYPFYLSYSDFDKRAKEKAQPLLIVLSKLPVVKMLQKFVRGVSLLTDPWARAFGWLDEIELADRQKNVRLCTKLIKEMRKDLFPAAVKGEPTKDLGKLNRQFSNCRFGESYAQLNDVVNRIRAYGDTATDRDGNETRKMFLLGKEERKKDKAELTKCIKAWTKQNKERMEEIENYSSFLHRELPLLSADEAIELPGLWDGLSRPDPSTRVTIAGFNAKVMPLGSLRAPKKVTLFGSDDREYPFLAKGGEDLRLDERLEQLFVVMNAQLRQDPEARARQLYIRTFGVTPVSKRAGLLEWCQNTQTLDEVVNDECKTMFTRYSQLKAASNHSDITHAEPWTRKWSTFSKTVAPRVVKLQNGEIGNLLEHGPVQNVGSQGVFNEKFRREQWPTGTQGYQRLLNEDPDVAGDLFRRALSETPKYLLKARLLKLAPSPEAYLQLRANCARTWSTANIAGYIAGVGDRHMGNFLFDGSDGSMIAIDFGYSFGVPFLLPIPELTPFRLSPQLLQCFEPLDGTVCITQMMTQTMRVLRQVGRSASVLTVPNISLLLIFLLDLPPWELRMCWLSYELLRRL